MASPDAKSQIKNTTESLRLLPKGWRLCKNQYIRYCHSHESGSKTPHGSMTRRVVDDSARIQFMFAGLDPRFRGDDTSLDFSHSLDGLASSLARDIFSDVS
jgi:hypothetical protein